MTVDAGWLLSGAASMLSRNSPPCAAYGEPVKQVGFRARLFLILLGFALIPTIVLAAAWEITVVRALPLLGTAPAMERIAATGREAIDATRGAPLTPAERALLDEHQRALDEGLLRGKQMEFLMTRRAPAVAALAALSAALLFGVVASRVAGHLSRNLSRPLSELVGWTETIGRARALEAERATALRESARQVAHELKNPLTPIRFAIARLRREAPDSLGETIDVLEVETKRLEEMARNFALFGRLPEGPRAPVDVGELVRAATRSAVPAETPVVVNVAEDVPMVPGHVDALGRALTNVLLNAVEASAPGSPVEVSARRAPFNGRPMVEVSV